MLKQQKQQIRALRVGDRVVNLARVRGTIVECPPADVSADEALWYWFGVHYDGETTDKPTRGWAMRPLSIVDRISELSE